MQLLAASDHAELKAEVSGTVVNRITFDSDRIAQVIRAPDGFPPNAAMLREANLNSQRSACGISLIEHLKFPVRGEQGIAC